MQPPTPTTPLKIFDVQSYQDLSSMNFKLTPQERSFSDPLMCDF